MYVSRAKYYQLYLPLIMQYLLENSSDQFHCEAQLN
jgi:hypothetical protein